MVWTVATMTTVGTVPLPTTDCGTTTVDGGSDHGGSWVGKDGGRRHRPTASEDDDPREGNHHAKGEVDALDYSNGRGIAGASTLTMMMRERTLASASARTAIARHFLPKRRRIAGPSRESRRKSLDDSAEGEDNNQQMTGVRDDGARRCRPTMVVRPHSCC